MEINKYIIDLSPLRLCRCSPESQTIIIKNRLTRQLYIVRIIDVLAHFQLYIYRSGFSD